MPLFSCPLRLPAAAGGQFPSRRQPLGRGAEAVARACARVVAGLGTRAGRVGLATLLAGLPLLAVELHTPLRALELNGSSVFVKAPWKVDLISYYTTVGQTFAEYYLTISLDPAAGAALAGLEVQQTRGVDTQFQFNTGLTRAFLGRPRQVGQPVPVEASFSQANRRISLRFPQPVQPGNTVTVVLRPWANPVWADTYMFQVTAIPDGPNPLPSPVGFGTLPMYEPTFR